MIRTQLAQLATCQQYITYYNKRARFPLFLLLTTYIHLFLIIIAPHIHNAMTR